MISLTCLLFSIFLNFLPVHLRLGTVQLEYGVLYNCYFYLFSYLFYTSVISYILIELRLIQADWIPFSFSADDFVSFSC